MPVKRNKSKFKSQVLIKSSVIQYTKKILKINPTPQGSLQWHTTIYITAYVDVQGIVKDEEQKLKKH